jgi:hypothetical protein
VRDDDSPVESAAVFSVVLPAVASLHGVPPAFFHSDVAVFNLSASRTTVVRATYRCTSDSCGSALQTFAIAPRQLFVLEDIVGRLFDAPETSGAIEFSSSEPIVVTSRLYTPERPAPTLGMFVPGLGPEKAFVESELLNLSHSADPAVGFRTNIGVFNPGDEARTAFVHCRDFRANLVGFTYLDVGPHQLVQINDGDLFREFSILRNVPAFYCWIRGSYLSPLYSWAAVIDNQSDDATFVVGQRFFPLPRILTLPAAASLHGAAGTFFRSDLALFNDDVLASTQVTARYRCIFGGCGETERAFSLGPGEMRVFANVVGELFGTPESAGAIEIVAPGHVNVTSRLYTPGPIRGTVGMLVPALEPAASATSQVLLLTSKGSRVNVGVVNPEGAAQVVTIRLFSETGQLLGSLTRLLERRRATQINDIFHALGVPGDVAAAYCLVEGNAPFRIYSYAAIIDNESQDPIFVTGQNDPERPPIED